jgi:hypothetical protein
MPTELIYLVVDSGIPVTFTDKDELASAKISSPNTQSFNRA